MPTANALGNMLDEWQAIALDGADSYPVSVPGRPVSVAGADTVRYTTSFDDPRGAGDDIAVLELRGLYAHSEIEVSGDRLDGTGPIEHDSYFRPLRIPFEPEETNDLEVTCRAPEDRFGGVHDTSMVPESHSVPGIWWGVSLESHSLPYIDSIDAEPELTEDGAELHLRTTVVTDTDIDERITYSLRPAGDLQTRGMMERAGVTTVGPGKTVVEHTIDVHDPALWWPHTLGEQNLYELTAKLDGTEYSITTGICNSSFVDGQFQVNGKPVPIRGVNLLTADETDIDRALEMNANLIRAHAHVLPDALYERCNEAGLLVWQDLPLTGPGAFDTDRGKAVARTISRQYGRNPSLAVYGVHDDPLDIAGDGLGSGSLDGLRLRWRAWRSSYDTGPAERVAGELPETRAVFPVIGGPGVDADAASYYPGWDYGEAADIDSLLKRYPADVVAEFGVGALPDGVDDDLTGAAGFDRQKHDRHVSGGVDESQQYQATVLRRIVERLRQDRVGTVAFALRDTDAAGMGVFGEDGSKKTAVGVLTDAYQPIQAFLESPDEAQSELVVVNDTSRGRTVTVEWEAGESDGSAELTVDAGGRSPAGSIEIPSGAETVTLTVRVGDQTVQNQYDR